MDAATHLNAQEVADLLGVCDDTVYRLAARGDLPSYRVGRKVRFLRTAVEAHMNGSRQ